MPKDCEQFVTFDKSTKVAGRLRAPSALRFWRCVLQASTIVLSWITQGYPLPWMGGEPPDFGGKWLKNKPGVRGPSPFGPREGFVDGAVAALLQTGAARECSRDFLALISPLNVVEQSDKLRLIIDQSFLSDHLVFERFRFEDLRMVPTIFEQSDYLFSIDLMSAYHHVELHRSAWKFMGFEWKGRFYHFCVLPFGLGPAPMVFHKVTMPLVQHWRSAGMKVLPYLDDFLGGGGSHAAHATAVRRVLSDMHQAGWLVSGAKVKLAPVKIIGHLGLVLDFADGVYRVSAAKARGLKTCVQELLAAGGRVRVRQLSRFAGLVQSLKLAVGPAAGFYTRHTYVAIESCSSWEGWLNLGQEVVRELQFWLRQDLVALAQPIWKPLHRVTGGDCDVYGDAGERGWGGCLCLPSGERLDARGYLSMWGRSQSSTWREAFACLQLLRTFGQRLAPGSRVVWYTDNQNLARSMTKGGSPVLVLHRLMVQVYEMVQQLRLDVAWEWIPRELNQWSDSLSKVFDKDDWRLHGRVFGVLDWLWGPHTCDRFASDMNAQLPRFNSYHWCPGTGGVNAFAQPLADWLHSNNWCNPPFCLIGELLRFLREIRGEATIIAPHWPRQPWWPLLCPDGRHLADFVLDARLLLPHPDLFASGQHSAGERGCRMPGYAFYALRVSFVLGARYMGVPRCTLPVDGRGGHGSLIPPLEVL